MVDDDALILEAVADMLTARDYQVTKAMDGLEALEQFRGRRTEMTWTYDCWRDQRRL